MPPVGHNSFARKLVVPPGETHKPRSLVHDFLERKSAGEPLGKSLKNAVFQARPPDIEAGECDEVPKFKLWKIRMRPKEDDEPLDWWFASTGIPILAATLGPLANVLSVGALVTFWRINIQDPTNPNGPGLPELQGRQYEDPRWCYWINVVSLIAGFVGNLFLLLNFTQRVRYLIALPMTIMLWYLACGCLLSGLIAMHIHVPPTAPYEMYSGGFWFGIAACAMYLLLSVMLMANMVGYVRGHYPQHFHLTQDQRVLIVQTMLFFIWLAGGAGLYSRLEGWAFMDALYYANVTILTVGFGDLYPTEDVGRALLIPYSIGGIIMLGLMISAIYKSVQELGEQNIVRHHFEQQRAHTKKTTVRSSLELQRREIEDQINLERAMAKQAARPSSRSPATGMQYQSTLLSRKGSLVSGTGGGDLSRVETKLSTINRKHKRVVLLKEEKDRFEAMRHIQKKAQTWRNWYRLTATLAIFGIFWCVGAIFFWQAEKNTVQMTYWQAIYFCWVSLLSIGYGDFSPKSGAGRCFFIIWSLIAVPVMSILASDLTTTVVSVFNNASIVLADFTVLPQSGMWKDLMERYPRLFLNIPVKIEKRLEAHAAAKEGEEDHIEKASAADRSSSTADGKDDQYANGLLRPDIEDIAAQQDKDMANAPDATALVRQLALAIQRTAHDLTKETPREYTYEEWVEFTRLIRFSAVGGLAEALHEQRNEGMIEWDWIGDDSPMMAHQNESQFVHDRLCESLVRYLRRNPPVGAFSDSLKAEGEVALRLRGNTESKKEGEDDAAITYAASIRSRKSYATQAEGDEKGVRNLHRVVEEDHEHEHGNHGIERISPKESPIR
ncbi:voltage-gated potassium channel [Tothia fuscella]|uniref:Voltage-gated potassium channel n=1 Tax=Tothia fuscella TaxID=1048955 RepID=A0A9P4NF87_9PEZI|nr:voltage-gated potassium channel [Tothia fuscella]